MTLNDEKRLKQLRDEMRGCLAVDVELHKGDRAMETSVSRILEKNRLRMDQIKSEIEDIISKAG